LPQLNLNYRLELGYTIVTIRVMFAAHAVNYRSGTQQPKAWLRLPKDNKHNPSLYIAYGPLQNQMNL